MVTKSQSESEAPAKVYQLDAVDGKVSDALKKLDDILRNIKGVATTEYVDTKIKNAKDEIMADVQKIVEDEVAKVHLEYRPIKNGALWFAALLVSTVVGIGVVTWNALQRK